ncbi:MAG: CTAG/PCC1 family protein [Candidatus Methanomethylophilaceae archaeon]|nr:CTAG/PCC1 family protein [Candidatus Methanomethylophilaceae archaeon]
MLRATLRITGAAARSAVPSISPEAGRELPRTETDITSDGEDAVICIRATDTSAMRAAINSYLECIRIIEDIDYLTKVRS